jgi:hypothetical protein
MREPLELDLDVAIEQLGAIGANEPQGREPSWSTTPNSCLAAPEARCSFRA